MHSIFRHLSALHDVAMTGPRFVREELAETLRSESRSLSPALIFTGSLERKLSEGGQRRAGQVSVYGFDQLAWDLVLHEPFAVPTGDQVILGSRTASALDAKVGETITLWLELPSSIPRDTLLGERNEETAELTLKVAGIAPEDSSLSRLSLLASQQLPLTAFVNLATLQDRLDLSAIRPTKRDPEGRLADINTMLAFGYWPETAPNLTNHLQAAWQPADLGLRVFANHDRNLLQVASADDSRKPAGGRHSENRRRGESCRLAGARLFGELADERQRRDGVLDVLRRRRAGFAVGGRWEIRGVGIHRTETGIARPARLHP